MAYTEEPIEDIQLVEINVRKSPTVRHLLNWDPNSEPNLYNCYNNNKCELIEPI